MIKMRGSWHEAKCAMAAALALGFAFPGTLLAAPWIDLATSGDQTTRSGFLEIRGTGFGGGGEVLVFDGAGSAPLNAHLATWSDQRIVVYIPESTALGFVDVEVWTSEGSSNPLLVDVTERTADGRVAWRLRMDAPYSSVRPAIGPDGTLYAVDVLGRLYAIGPNGALQWLVVGAGGKGVAVGPDGTIYTGSEAEIRAFFPDGTEKWTFVQDPRAFILIGVAVGPDGNVYGVASSGMGVFSLRPDGSERWRTPEPYGRPNVMYGEILFGPNFGEDQLYFYANGHLRGVRLSDGQPVFSLNAATPAVSPLDGSVHTASRAFDPDGFLLWQFDFPVSGVSSAPDVGGDGVHYVVHGSDELFAIDPDGRELWSVLLNNRFGRPIVDPLDTMVVMGSNDLLSRPGLIQAVDVSRRRELWTVMLPAEETDVYNPWTGQFGFNQYVDTPARFSADGQFVYMHTAIASGGLVEDRTFLQAIQVGDGTGGTTTVDGGTTTGDGGGTTTGGGKGHGKGGKKKSG